MELPAIHFAWALVTGLVKEKGYQVLHVERRAGEERFPIFHLVQKNQISLHYIRISVADHVWMQVMERERMEMKHRCQRLCNLFRARRYDALNLYIFTKPPLQDNRLYVQEGFASDGINNLQVGILDWQEQQYIGQGQILYTLHCSPEELSALLHHYEVHSVEEYVHQIQQGSLDMKKRREERSQVGLTQNRFSFTYLFIAFNLLMFIVLTLNGGSTNINTLIRFGAKVNPLIVDGEWWRLITPMFLHIGFTHFLFNNLALYVLGSSVERMYGSARFVIIYFLAGIGGNVASFLFSPSVSAGASGAIFGLLGALLYFGLRHRELFMKTIGYDVLVMVGLNLVIGFIVPGIDNFGHIGGLVFGFVTALFVGLPREQKGGQRVVAAIILAALLVGGTVSGSARYLHSAEYLIYQGDLLFHQENYIAALEKYEEALLKDQQLLYQRDFIQNYGGALFYLERYTEMINVTEAYLAENEPVPELYYNISLAYLRLGDYEMAQAALEQALEANPNIELRKTINALLIKLEQVEPASQETE